MVSEGAPRRKRQRFNTAAGKSIPITIDQPRNCGKEQQAVIAILTRALYEEISQVVNYDHVKLTIPKKGIPLVYRKHRYDLACLVRERVILVDVVSVNVRYWLKGEDTEHGKVKEQDI